MITMRIKSEMTKEEMKKVLGKKFSWSASDIEKIKKEVKKKDENIQLSD